MYLGILTLVLVSICIIWLFVLTYITLRVQGHYNRLTYGVTQGNLHEVLGKVLNDSSQVRLEVKHLGRLIQAIHIQGKAHIQNIGIVRFNPFADTGGNQSFTLAILDAERNGIVLTSLYARAGSRWYSKEVRLGKSKDIVLSKEEEEAIALARVVGDKIS